MRTTALLLTATLALGASSVRAEDTAPAPKRQRGFLTGLGLGLFVGGLTGLGAGLGGLLTANDASERLAKYSEPLSAGERPTVDVLRGRRSGGTTLATFGFVAGTLALAGGVACLIIDTPRTSVAFMPTAQGGMLVLSGQF